MLKKEEILKTEHNFANSTTKNKISFFSAMLVVVGSCIGSGIFFKAKAVLEGSQGSIILAMICWIFVGIAVLAMALALLEIASARNDNLSLIGWCKTFNNRFIYKMSKNFMFFIYTPVKGFFLPLYLIWSFQDAVASIYIQNGMPYHGFGTNVDWLIIMFLTIAVSSYFIIVCGLSAKAGNIQNWIITSLKFFPLILAGVIGFVIFGMNHGQVVGNYDAIFRPSEANTPLDIYTFKFMSPGFGFFIASTGILYAYDGFYSSASIKTEMKDPKKSPLAILVGLIVTTAIYLLIAISMSLGSQNGDPQGLVSFFAQHNILPLFAVFEMLIAVGIMGVINGYSLFATRFMVDLARDNELPFSKKAATYIAKKNRFVGIIYDLSITIPTIILLTVIGIFYFNDHSSVLFISDIGNLPPNIQDLIKNNNQSFNDLNFIQNNSLYYNYGTKVGELYTFCDLVSNWGALFVFMFVALSIYGGIRNRKNEFVKVQKFKFFKPFAYLSIIFISLPLFMSIFEPFANLFLLFRIPTSTSNYDVNYWEAYILVPRIMATVMLFIYIGFTVLPTIISDRLDIKKYGSIANAEKQKLAEINVILGEPLKADSNSDMI